MTCSRCNSKGFILINTKKTVCPDCKGRMESVASSAKYRVIFRDVFIVKIEVDSNNPNKEPTYYIVNKYKTLIPFKETFVFRSYREASNFCEKYRPILNEEIGEYIPKLKRDIK